MLWGSTIAKVFAVLDEKNVKKNYSIKERRQHAARRTA
jgi:hypothetical protein